jgi:carbonic anhydrase
MKGVMRILRECFTSNERWAREQKEKDPAFFSRLSLEQRPELLWIGCSDSRLHPNELIGKAPGDVFVHRNVANIVVHTDANCLSVLQFAVEVLGVSHIIICGHYNCGGIKAAMDSKPLGLIDNWLRHIRDVYMINRAELDAIEDKDQRANRMCELNIAAQVANVCYTTIVQDAWRRGQNLTVHGWICSLTTGLLRDLDLCVERPDQIPDVYRIDAL